jgi:glycosyltransferase involved in cell wall biosynthesis
MRIRVAMIASVFYPSIGGAQTHTLRLSQKLQDRGVEVTVVTRHHAGLARFELIDGIPTYRVGSDGGGKAMEAIRYVQGAIRHLQQQRQILDILHCHQMISPMTIGMLAQRLTDTKLVINPHRSGSIGDMGVLTLRRPITGKLRIALAHNMAHAFVCISPAIHQELIEGGIPVAKLWDIANGVDIEAFCPVEPTEQAKLREHLRLPEGPLVVFAGRLAREKGIDVLLRAWPAVIAQIPNARLVIIGQGDERTELEKLVKGLGLTNSVIFTGGTDAVDAYLKAANVFVLPSFAEGFPIALLEAMATQLVCVGTAIDGTMQLIQDQQTGLLVPPGDSVALGKALIHAFHPHEASQWARSARQLVTNRYSLDTVAERYIEMYTAILQP